MNQEDVIGLLFLVIFIVAIMYFSFRASRKSAEVRRAAMPPESAVPIDNTSTSVPVLTDRKPLLTIALIVVSVLITLDTGLGKSVAELDYWIIATPGSEGLADVFSGQVWRLMAPAFIHFGPMHLLFNMLWLWDLGRIIEDRKGWGMLANFVLVVGIFANLAQYFIGDSPYFGGMSGVVYGLLGYCWMQGKRNPAFGAVLNKQTVIMMFGWFVLCWTGLLGPIANWAHTAGLLAGIVWGYLEAVLPRNKVS